jgi:Lectin C-type domain
MKRLIKILALALAAGAPAAAQAIPTDVEYRTANQHTYLVTPGSVDWQTARAYARSLGGYLVSIQGINEQSFVESKYAGLGQPLWIGISDHETEGIYKWDSGEPVVYTNFCNGQPDNWNGVEDFGEIFSAHTGGLPCWNDIQSPPTYAAPTRGIVELAYGKHVDFDGASTSCSTSPFPTPLGATSDPDGVSWNGAGQSLGRRPSVTTTAEFGMPVSGSKYLRFPGSGQFDLGSGALIARPLPAGVNELRILIPPGTKGVSLAYDFISPEVAPYNDGMDISVVDVNGNLVARVIAHDVIGSNFGVTPSTGVYCIGSAGFDLLPAASVKTIAKYLPALPYPAYLSIAGWNGIDDSIASFTHVDAIQFWGTGNIDLAITAPFGSGSIRLANTQGAPNTPYWTAVTLAQGAYPNGWLFGLDITLAELLNQVSFGVPFAGTLDATGSSSFTLASGVPPGIPLFAVTIQFGPEVTASSPESFVTF